jgi:hypothetical protein
MGSLTEEKKSLMKLQSRRYNAQIWLSEPVGSLISTVPSSYVAAPRSHTNHIYHVSRSATWKQDSAFQQRVCSHYHFLIYHPPSDRLREGGPEGTRCLCYMTRTWHICKSKSSHSCKTRLRVKKSLFRLNSLARSSPPSLTPFDASAKAKA